MALSHGPQSELNQGRQLEAPFSGAGCQSSQPPCSLRPAGAKQTRWKAPQPLPSQPPDAKGKALSAGGSRQPEQLWRLPFRDQGGGYPKKLQSQPWCRLRRWAIKREADVLASLKCQKSKAKFPSSAPGPHLRSLSKFSRVQPGCAPTLL